MLERLKKLRKSLRDNIDELNKLFFDSCDDNPFIKSDIREDNEGDLAVHDFYLDNYLTNAQDSLIESLEIIDELTAAIEDNSIKTP